MRNPTKVREKIAYSKRIHIFFSGALMEPFLMSVLFTALK